ncbi:MAG: hypothetical protein KDA88_16045 [Planctomycetaceae bacterium]|nr:hypothetical protein [Planctomycetaceae bacterium]MCB9953318.1 hypothetical protein [Planctomycetaceae bacterium]
MSDPRIPLKNRYLAAFLAFLCPGAGHFYQGRHVKGAIFSVCIIALFLTGMAMADWKAVQPPGRFGFSGTKLHYDDGRPAAPGNGLRTLKFAAQASIGVPAVISIVQNQRFRTQSNDVKFTISGPTSYRFSGTGQVNTETELLEGKAEGTLTLEPVRGNLGAETIGGRFVGTINGKPVELSVDSVVAGPALGANSVRSVVMDVVESSPQQSIGTLHGGIPRSFGNHFLMTMSLKEEDDLQNKLGKRHELAMVLTWIAGLLNVLVIWDAAEGPAYGYGDEEETPESDKPVADGGTEPPAASPKA